MKKIMPIICGYRFELAVLLGTYGLFGVMLWLADVRLLSALVGLLIFAGAMTAVLMVVVGHRRAARRRALFQAFLGDPSFERTAQLKAVTRADQHPSIDVLGAFLRDQQAAGRQMAADLSDYEDYVERWVHDAHTPLSLLALIIDNRRAEWSPDTDAKLRHVCSQLQGDVSQMLFYARLKSSVKDYYFESVLLQDCVAEVLAAYAPLLVERGFEVETHLSDERVYTDRQGLGFMLGQMVSNAVKYAAETPKLCIGVEQRERATVLSIADRGRGVKAHDLPYIFEKGFTGSPDDRRSQSTGMGLYLCRKMADDLKLDLTVDSVWGEGFKISIVFPV